MKSTRSLSLNLQRLSLIAIIPLILTSPEPTSAQSAHQFLPPELPWSGRSLELQLEPGAEWVTPGEQSGLTRTPRYAETVRWIERLVNAAPELSMISIGQSAEGRHIWMVIASAEGASTPEALKASNKPTLLAQAGIHSGEIDGKDAGMMLLRDMTVLGRREDLLRKANLLFIPILSVDGHERFSAFSRTNQRGPTQTGWRTNARNLNLNRDYTKLETEEIRAVVRVLNHWDPDLYIDLHVTDGADYQYDITWGYSLLNGWSPAVTGWLEEWYSPAVTSTLKEWGHLPGPLVWPRNERDMADGNRMFSGSPRFSNQYGNVRHLPTVLVENHSLKPYPQRVLGTYVLLAASMEILSDRRGELRQAIDRDQSLQPKQVVLDWKEADPPVSETHDFAGVRSELVDSPVTGQMINRWTGEPITERIEFQYETEPKVVVRRPDYYFLPSAWSHIADRLRMHGISIERVEESEAIQVETYRLPQAGVLPPGDDDVFDENSFIYEGRVRTDPGTVETELAIIDVHPGDYKVRTNQPLGDLAVLLLEPESPDSLFQWGYFLETLTRSEYIAPYVMEPLARAMLARDPDLAASFAAKLEEDLEFAADPKARLAWFYRKTKYYDPGYRLYPIARSVD
jgi:hypothetical protein